MNLFDDPIDPRLRGKLDALNPVPERDADAARQDLSRFLSQAAQLKPAVSTVAKSRPNEWKLFQIRQERSKMATTLTSLILIFTLLFGGAGVTAFAAQASQPDELLYPVKTITEAVQFSLVSAPEDKVETQFRFLERRFAELRYMLEEEVIPPEAFVNRLQSQLQIMNQLAAGLNDLDMHQALLRYQQMLQQQTMFMQRLDPEAATPVQAQVRTQIQEQLRLQIAFCEAGLQDPQLFRDRVMLGENGLAEPPSMEPGTGPVETPVMNQPGPGAEQGKGDSTPKPSEDAGPQPESGPGPEAGAGPEAGPGPQTDYGNDGSAGGSNEGGNDSGGGEGGR